MAIMSAVGIKELKNHLTHYVRRAKQGDEVVITERGRPVAILHSIESEGPAQSLDARLGRLASQGLIALPAHKPLKRLRLAKTSGRPISKLIVADRR